MFDRISFGFINPNHAAAMICALAPFCWGWRRLKLVGRTLCGCLFLLLFLTQSRTGFLVWGFEVIAWLWLGRKRYEKSCIHRTFTILLGVGVLILALVWMWPRLELDDSILNRPLIWLAGLKLAAANPSGVGLGYSGTLASAFLLGDLPEIRTLIGTHLTLLVELGWSVGWVWVLFIILACCGIRAYPRLGIAFVGLVVSGLTSTIFDWGILFNGQASRYLWPLNWYLSWFLLLLFVVSGVVLIRRRLCQPYLIRTILSTSLLACGMIFSTMFFTSQGTPRVRGEWVFFGESPPTLALYPPEWSLKMVVSRLEGAILLPLEGVTRIPRRLDLTQVSQVVLFGACCEWEYLITNCNVRCIVE